MADADRQRLSTIDRRTPAQWGRPKGALLEYWCHISHNRTLVVRRIELRAGMLGSRHSQNMFRFVLENWDRTDALEDVVSIEAAATNSVVV